MSPNGLVLPECKGFIQMTAKYTMPPDNDY